MGIKHGVANLLGMGKYAAMEKRNKELEETVLKEKQRLQKQFAAAVRQEAEKAVAPYEQQKNADRLLINALQSKVSVLSESNMELSSRNSRMENRHQTDLEWRDRLLRVFADLPTLNQNESASANGLLIMLPPRQNCQTWIYITPKVRWTEWHKDDYLRSSVNSNLWMPFLFALARIRTWYKGQVTVLD